MEPNFVTLHERMVRNAFLNIELLLNDGVKELSEYDVQGLMFLFYRRAFANTRWRAEREKEGKVDCVVYEDDQVVAFYEIKAYFKRYEKLAKKHFDHDLEKIVGLLKERPGARGFVLIAGAKRKFLDEELQSFGFVSAHLNDGNQTWQTYLLPNQDKVRLRPSRKQHRGKCVVVTWEVKLPR